MGIWGAGARERLLGPSGRDEGRVQALLEAALLTENLPCAVKIQPAAWAVCAKALWQGQGGRMEAMPNTPL